MRAWPQEHVDLLRKEAAKGGTWRDVCERLRGQDFPHLLNPSAVGSAAHRYGITKPDLVTGEEQGPVPDDLARPDQDKTAVIASLRGIVTRQEADLRRLRHVRAEIIDTIREETRALPAPPVVVLPPGPPKKGRKPLAETAVAHIADSQIGARVEPEEILGLSGYDFDIFLQRADRYEDAFWTIIEDQRSGRRTVDDLFVLFGGDIVEGELIYRGQVHQIDGPLYRQVMLGSRRFAEFLLRCSARFKRIRVVCIRGNHGRAGAKKGDFADITNWDNIAYAFIALLLVRCPNVEVWVAPGPAAGVNVYGHKILMTHGDEFRSWLQIPAYGLLRAVQKMISLTQTHFDLYLCGHHHIPIQIPLNFTKGKISGSWVGGSKFSVGSMQAAGVPEQYLFFAQEKRVIGSEWPIYLAEKPEPAEYEEGRFFTPMVRPTDLLTTEEQRT